MLLWPVMRFVWSPRHVIVAGQAYRMRVPLEASAAGQSLARYAGVNDFVTEERGRLFSGNFPGDPVCLIWDSALGARFFQVVFDSRGHPCLPPVAFIPNEHVYALLPIPFYIGARDGSQLTAVLTHVRPAHTPPWNTERAVWIHCRNKWRNVLKLSNSVVTHLEMKPSPWDTHWIEFRMNRPVRIEWDASSESFRLPQSLPPSMTVLPLLPDITLDNWRPPP